MLVVVREIYRPYDLHLNTLLQRILRRCIRTSEKNTIRSRLNLIYGNSHKLAIVVFFVICVATNTRGINVMAIIRTQNNREFAHFMISTRKCCAINSGQSIYIVHPLFRRIQTDKIVIFRENTMIHTYNLTACLKCYVNHPDTDNYSVLS